MGRWTAKSYPETDRSDEEFAVGITTPHTQFAETVEDAARMIKRALHSVPKERLALKRDEPKIFTGQLRTIVEGAKVARKD